MTWVDFLSNEAGMLLVGLALGAVAVSFRAFAHRIPSANRS